MGDVRDLIPWLGLQAHNFAAYAERMEAVAASNQAAYDRLASQVDHLCDILNPPRPRVVHPPLSHEEVLEEIESTRINYIGKYGSDCHPAVREAMEIYYDFLRFAEKARADGNLRDESIYRHMARRIEESVLESDEPKQVSVSFQNGMFKLNIRPISFWDKVRERNDYEASPQPAQPQYIPPVETTRENNLSKAQQALREDLIRESVEDVRRGFYGRPPMLQSAPVPHQPQSKASRALEKSTQRMLRQNSNRPQNPIHEEIKRDLIRDGINSVRRQNQKERFLASVNVSESTKRILKSVL